MIRLILLRFWPVFLPLLIYIAWHRLRVRTAVKRGLPVPRFRDGPLYWTVLSSLGIAILCFLWMGAHIESEKGDYVPPAMKDGVIVPGHVER